MSEGGYEIPKSSVPIMTKFFNREIKCRDCDEVATFIVASKIDGSDIFCCPFHFISILEENQKE